MHTFAICSVQKESRPDKACKHPVPFLLLDKKTSMAFTVKALLSPRGGVYLIFDTPEWGLLERELIREGALLERGAYSKR